MDDAEYNRLWAKIDDAHIRIGRLEGEREMLVKALNDIVAISNKILVGDVNIRIAVNRAERLLETMKGE